MKVMLLAFVMSVLSISAFAYESNIEMEDGEMIELSLLKEQLATLPACTPALQGQCSIFTGYAYVCNGVNWIRTNRRVCIQQ